MTKVLLKRLPLHTSGRTLLVGDIHGHFTRLQKALDAVGFDPTKDRLIATGDLIDRGPESIDVIKWLNKPWFHSVAGNHESFALRYPDIDVPSWHYWGGGWFIALEDDEQLSMQALLDTLPVAIEVETSQGLLGVVHAEPYVDDWFVLRDILTLPDVRPRLRKDVIGMIQHSRSRFQREDLSKVRNVRAVVVGHQPIGCRVTLGNVIYIDTRGWVPSEGYFTLLNAETLKPEPVMKRKV